MSQPPWQSKQWNNREWHEHRDHAAASSGSVAWNGWREEWERQPQQRQVPPQQEHQLAPAGGAAVAATLIVSDQPFTAMAAAAEPQLPEGQPTQDQVALSAIVTTQPNAWVSPIIPHPTKPMDASWRCWACQSCHSYLHNTKYKILWEHEIFDHIKCGKHVNSMGGDDSNLPTDAVLEKEIKPVY